MSIFSRIASALAGGVGKVGAAVSGLRAALAGLANSEVRRQAAFAIAMIALSAKMAKADGVVTRPEIDAFCRIFTIPPGEEKNVSRVYNLAKRDIAGFQAYARDVARLLSDDPAMLEAILDGLFEIAKADGAVHERELALSRPCRGDFRLRRGRLRAHPRPPRHRRRGRPLSRARTPTRTGTFSICAGTTAGSSPTTIRTG